MSVELEPAELGFRRPYTNEVSQTLRLRNNNEGPLAFKVKTTAPKQYCVRPNSGTIEPGESVDVSVVLQPMKTDPPPDARCKDKFLVQSVTVPGGQGLPPWAELERNFRGSIQERKIRVQYLPADDSAHQVNGVDSHVDDSTLSPPPVYTPHAQHTATMDQTPPSKADTRAVDSDTIASHSTPLSQAATSAEEPSNAALVDQLAKAKAEIARLKKEGDSGLRQRNVGSKASQSSGAGSMGATATLESGQAGVPVSTVAILCLITFLLSYFLF